MSEAMTEAGAALKLFAGDADDLAVVSAMLQDALVPVGDMTYLADERRFLIVANRFRWEKAGERVAGRIYERVNCGVTFETVHRVRTRRLDRRRKDGLLSLLAVRSAEGAIELLFAAGAELRLEVERIACSLQDLGAPWPTRWRPSHDDAAEGMER